MRCNFDGKEWVSQTAFFRRCSWQQHQWVRQVLHPAPCCPTSCSHAAHDCCGCGCDCDCGCGSAAHAPGFSSGSVADPGCGFVVDPGSSSGSVAAPDCGSVVDPGSSSGFFAAPCCGGAHAVCVLRRGPGRRAQFGAPTETLPDCARVAPLRSLPPLSQSPSIQADRASARADGGAQEACQRCGARARALWGCVVEGQASVVVYHQYPHFLFQQQITPMNQERKKFAKKG